MSDGFDAPTVERVYQVTDMKAAYIVAGYRSVVDPDDIPGWEERAAKIEVTSEEQLSDMEAARELRLQIRQVRIAVEKKRKELKEDALRESKAIDGLGKMIKERIEPIEEHLQAQEDFVKRLEEERERERREKAEELLRQQEEREAREREEARLAEEKRIREENERLRKESEERARQAAEAAAEHEKELAAERAAREKERAEREAEQKAAEAKERKEREAAEKKARQEREAERKRHEQELAKAREESARLAAMVKCPACGHEFDGREQHTEEDA